MNGNGLLGRDGTPATLPQSGDSSVATRDFLESPLDQTIGAGRCLVGGLDRRLKGVDQPPLPGAGPDVQLDIPMHAKVLGVPELPT
jgi:hypothetical protein